MRIGILTLPLNQNYGGILQAYALQTVLERLGHEVRVVEWKRPYGLPFYKMPYVYGKRMVMNLLGHKIPVLYEQKCHREQSIIRQNTDKFIKKYIHLVEYDDFSDIKESEYDAIIVGSDQVWRPRYFGIKQIGNAYLKFAEGWNIKRIAYAASFGTDEWEYTAKQTSGCGRLLRMFDAVSVREDSGVRLFRERFGVGARHVLDPTMLLDKNDYVKLFETVGTPNSKGNLLCYMLDETEEKRGVVRRIADEKGLTPFNVKSQSDSIASPIGERIQPPLEQWLRGFYDAEFVVTDSFHACVFSILFGKPFVAVGNADRGMSRFNSLFSMFGLEDRLVANGHAYTECKDADRADIMAMLAEKKREAMNYLVGNLNTTDGKQ